jgi:Ferritin-like domain
VDLTEIVGLVNKSLDRRSFLKSSGMAGIGAASVAVLGGSLAPLVAQSNPILANGKNAPATIHDTPTDIFTAALVAEDLATVFYYNGLVGPVIMDPNLAGPGGTARNPNPSDSNPGNVAYLQAAMTEEVLHASLFRSLLGIQNPSQDPYQTFYFPANTFETLTPFLATLNALENAFIGAYLTATQEFAVFAAEGASGYTAAQLEYFAKVAAAICGVESEHRALGRVIANMNPANNLGYEQTDGITSLAHGSNSAEDLLAPFLNPATGPGYSLISSLAGQLVGLPVTTSLPDSTLY